MSNHDIAVGAILDGRYELRERNADAPAWERYRAFDREVGVEVSLWVTSPTVFPDAPSQRALMDAADRIRSLSHPHILRVFDVGLVRSRVYVTMQPGGSTRIDLNPGSVMHYAEAVADALTTAHAAGWVHGHLTPGEIIQVGNLVKVCGIGLYRRMDLRAAKRQWDELTRFWAPEIVSGEPASPAADVFSLAAILAEVLAGNAIADPHAAVDELKSRSAALAAILTPALDSRPAKRPTSLRALCNSLQAALRVYSLPLGGVVASELSDEMLTVPTPMGKSQDSHHQLIIDVAGPGAIPQSIEDSDADNSSSFDELTLNPTIASSPPPFMSSDAGDGDGDDDFPAPATVVEDRPPLPAQESAPARRIPDVALRSLELPGVTRSIRKPAQTRTPGRGQATRQPAPEAAPQAAPAPQAKAPVPQAAAGPVPTKAASSPAPVAAAGPVPQAAPAPQQAKALLLQVPAQVQAQAAGPVPKAQPEFPPAYQADGDDEEDGITRLRPPNLKQPAAAPLAAISLKPQEAPASAAQVPVVDRIQPRIRSLTESGGAMNLPPEAFGRYAPPRPERRRPAWLYPAVGAALLAVVGIAIVLGGKSTPAPMARAAANRVGTVLGASPTPDKSIAAPATCPAGMVRLPGEPAICMDPFEVSEQAGAYTGAARGVLPATSIKHADAGAACEKRGARLCTSAEWERACRGPAARDWPYGATFVKDACNIGSGRLTRTGSQEQCKTEDGIFDLSGNAGEWVAEGQVRGGSALTRGEGRCDRAETLNALTAFPDIGFRCCAPLAAP